MDTTEAERAAPRVFISYSSHNADAASAVAEALEMQGVACWIAPRDVPPGTRYGEAIIHGINACSLLVLLLSKHSNVSPQVFAEVERAVSKGLSVVTVRLEAVDLDASLEYFLSAFHWIDASSTAQGAYLERLVEAVRQKVTAAQLTQVKAVPQPVPPVPTRRDNLPQQMTSFIGREKEAVEVKALLYKSRLLTLTGAGGAGKSRLSLQVAAELLMGDGDGVWLVELAPLSDPALVPQAVADVFGIREGAGQTLAKTLVEELREKRLLLILDNCEHVLAACSSLAADLLRSCPGVHLLASSREPLGVPGEQVYHVPSLSLPDPKQAQTAESLAQYESARLMIERAQAVRPDFAVTDQNADAVAQVCRRLDGIPLAIELAAARVRSLSVEEVNARLDNRFRLLTGGSKTLLPRQQTLRALIDWSYDLLTDQEKMLLRHLSVFTGGWTLEGAEAVGAGESIEDWEVLDLLTALTDKSLVIADFGSDATRYRLLETIRQYSLERLQAAGDAEDAHARHAAWCLSFAEEAYPMLRGPEAKVWLARLDTDHDNLRAALAWSLEDRDSGQEGLGPDASWRLAGAMTDFWYLRSYVSEGRRWLESLLSRSASASIAPDLRFSALRWAGIFATIQCDYGVAQTHSEEALALAREMGDREKVGRMLGDLGALSYVRSDFAAALAWYDQGLEISRETGNQRSRAVLLTNSGSACRALGDYAAAEVRQRAALDLFQELGDRRATAIALTGLGSLAHSRGDYPEARALFEQALALFKEFGDRREVAMCQGNIGAMASGQEECPAAKSMLEEAIATLRELGDTRNVVGFLSGLGNVLILQGDTAAARATLEENLGLMSATANEEHLPNVLRNFARLATAEKRSERAATLYGAAEAMERTVKEQRAPFHAAENAREIASVRAAWSEEAFDAAYAAGQAMTRDQAAAFARIC